MSTNQTGQEFEKGLEGSQETVAEFENHRRGLLGNIQHMLHVNPALVPLIVLIASIILFGMLVGQRFFSPFAMTLILQQVQIVGIVAAAQRPRSSPKPNGPRRPSCCSMPCAWHLLKDVQALPLLTSRF